MPDKAIQDYYPEDIAVCYGCGKSNKHGYQIKTFWQGEETVSRFQPQPYHTAFPGYVYGGLIASLIDCHATGTAASAKNREEGQSMGTETLERFVTVSLHEGQFLVISSLKNSTIKPQCLHLETWWISRQHVSECTRFVL